MSKKCPYCGCSIEDDLIICPYCDNELPKTNNKSEELNIEDVKIINKEESIKTKKKKGGFIRAYIDFEKKRARYNAYVLPVSAIILMIMSIIGAFVIHPLCLIGLLLSGLLFLIAFICLKFYES